MFQIRHSHISNFSTKQCIFRRWKFQTGFKTVPFWIPLKKICLCLYFVCEKEKITSQYKGVCWDTKSRKWRVQLSLKGEKPKYGGYFKDELDAAKRANQLCEELRIPLQNPEISAIPNQQYQVAKKVVFFHGVVKESFVDQNSIQSSKVCYFE